MQTATNRYDVLNLLTTLTISNQVTLVMASRTQIVTSLRWSVENWKRSRADGKYSVRANKPIAPRVIADNATFWERSNSGMV